ncbi:MAG: hypothetical protein JSR17_10880 [Proteobacteria bacterium]|nr:hypothetical protein [Pseudomonadota bacterium]
MVDTEYKIMIATPCYNGQCSMGYALSLLKTYAAAKEVSRLKFVHKYIAFDPSIPRARNYMVATMMGDPSITHLMFIDADIKWEAQDILKLIMADKPIIGAAIPMKNYKWERLRLDKIKELINNPNISQDEFKKSIKMHLLDYAVVLEDDIRETKEGIIEVKRVGTAFMLIQRYVFNQMIKAYPQKKINTTPPGYPDDFTQNLYAFFDQENFQGEYLSSDYSFCKRYKDIGGRIFANLSITVGHQGSEEYSGNLFEIAKVPKQEIHSKSIK